MKEGRGEGKEAFLAFFPTPPRSFTRGISLLRNRTETIATQAVKAKGGCSNKTNNNGPFPSSENSHFQNEASAKSFL